MQYSSYQAPESSVVAVVMDMLFSCFSVQNSEIQMQVYGQTAEGICF